MLRPDLDLSGNPIWFRPECKHRCVAELPALRRYDDEELTELDRELAAESIGGAAAYSRARNAACSASAAVIVRVSSSQCHLDADATGDTGPPSPIHHRPSTAPAATSGRLSVPFRVPVEQHAPSPTVRRHVANLLQTFIKGLTDPSTLTDAGAGPISSTWRCGRSRFSFACRRQRQRW